MIRFIAAFFLLLPFAAFAQADIQTVLQAHREVIEKSSRTTIGPAIDAVRDSGLPGAVLVLDKWQNKDMWQRKSDGLFFWGEPSEIGIKLHDFTTGDVVADLPKGDLDQLKPNAGVRGLLASALVQFQLLDPNPATRQAALDSLARNGAPENLAPLKASIEGETDAVMKVQKERLYGLMAIQYAADPAERIAAIESFKGDTSTDVRAALNPLLTVSRKIAPVIPDTANVALIPKLSEAEAYTLIAAAGLAPARISLTDQRAVLTANLVDGKVGGVPVAELNTERARFAAYKALQDAGIVPPAALPEDITTAVASFKIWDEYSEPNPDVTAAAQATLRSIETKLGVQQGIDLGLDALSLASIYFLAAIGLAITFGVMGVINMAHGEFIMMGAYTGYVVQQIVPDYTISIIIAIPLAFAVTFAAGVALERLVIRWLYNRPLETLLATFGISIALQQIAKNIFGTQARPLTSPAWLDGSLVINDIIGISYIRIAIFVLALIFLAVFLFIMKKTRLGLEVRAVTQNPKMAASMGISPDKINMLTFGLGSGIAGIAGVAIGLFAKVTSELGSDYIVQSFMTVVVGGVGNIWGTLLGASMIGGLQKGIEFLNPSNTLAAQTYMILFIIIFIQFRPRGIIALKGRAAGD
ncbi:MAG: urea ABC transporter permease subunit UrtB [Deltaproteobacteria bacterium]